MYVSELYTSTCVCQRKLPLLARKLSKEAELARLADETKEGKETLLSSKEELPWLTSLPVDHVQPGGGHGCHDARRDVHNMEAIVGSCHHPVPERNRTLGVFCAHNGLS